MKWVLECERGQSPSNQARGMPLTTHARANTFGHLQIVRPFTNSSYAHSRRPKQSHKAKEGEPGNTRFRDVEQKAHLLFSSVSVHADEVEDVSRFTPANKSTLTTSRLEWSNFQSLDAYIQYILVVHSFLSCERSRQRHSLCNNFLW